MTKKSVSNMQGANAPECELLRYLLAAGNQEANTSSVYLTSKPVYLTSPSLVILCKKCYKCRGTLCVKYLFWGGAGGDLNAHTGNGCICSNQLMPTVLISASITSNRAERRQALAHVLKHCKRLKTISTRWLFCWSNRRKTVSWLPHKFCWLHYHCKQFSWWENSSSKAKHSPHAEQNG